jgi:hypothetical protein
MTFDFNGFKVNVKQVTKVTKGQKEEQGRGDGN